MTEALGLDKLAVPLTEQPAVRKEELLARITDLRRRVVNGEEVTVAELREATNALRKHRELQAYSAGQKKSSKAKTPKVQLRLEDL